MGFLYRLDFASGKRYVGVTNLPAVKCRMYDHRHRAKNGGDKAVHRAWRKHGEPRVVTLAIATGDYLLDLEQRAVRAYGTYGSRGYNLTPGGDFNPASLPASRAKNSSYHKGRKYSDETRRRMSLAAKGHPKSAEWRAKISAAHIGKRFSIETRARISAARKRIEAEKRRAACSESL